MAAIDKTYVNNYEDWKRIIDWCKENKFICTNGTEVRMIDRCYYPDYSEEEVKEWLKKAVEIPVMNTGYKEDYFLIKYCPIDIVQERMREVYDEEYYNSIKNGNSEYDTFTMDNDKIGTRVFLKKRRSRRNYSKTPFFVEAKYNDSYLWYSDYVGRFLWPNELGIATSNSFNESYSIKALIRRLRKMKLPKGTKVRVLGYYVNDEFEFEIK